MTPFWKPVKFDASGHEQNPYRKVLGNGLYELWCRCDICAQSGPVRRFIVCYRDRDDATCYLCHVCSADKETLTVVAGAGFHTPSL